MHLQHCSRRWDRHQHPKIHTHTHTPPHTQKQTHTHPWNDKLKGIKLSKLSLQAQNTELDAVLLVPVNKALLQISLMDGVVNEAVHTGTLERSARPAPILCSPGLLLRCALWERLESSAGANKAGRYARARERERKTEERKADDDVTWERSKNTEMKSKREKDAEAELQRFLMEGLGAAYLTRRSGSIAACCMNLSVLHGTRHPAKQ